MTIYDYLTASPSLLLFLIFLLSLMIGSFLNVVIYRLPLMLKREWKSDCIEFLSDEFNSKSNYLFSSTVNEQLNEQLNKTPFNLSIPRSHCPSCGHPISALENIPVISWLFLRGKCSQCNIRISIRYPIIELSTALLSTLAAYYYGVQWFTPAVLILVWALIALTMIDFDTQLLPDNITLPLLWLGIIISLLHISDISLTDSVIGAIAGYMSLWSVYQLFKLITGKEGMGYGDFKLLAVLGAWLGWQALPLILFLSALVGAVVGISLILFLGRDKNIPIPFGPYLSAAGFIALLWYEPIQQFYFNIAGL